MASGSSSPRDRAKRSRGEAGPGAESPRLEAAAASAAPVAPHGLIRVKMLLYSGVEDPEWVLSPDQAAQLASLLQEEREETHLGAVPVLGYRGFEVHEEGGHPRAAWAAEGPRSHGPVAFSVAGSLVTTPSADQPNLVDQDSRMEKFLLRTGVLQGKIDRPTEDFVNSEIATSAAKRASFHAGFSASAARSRVTLAAATAVLGGPPVYNPGKWNNNPTTKARNNCYNYANDTITNTFAQPGRGTGAAWSPPPRCADVTSASQRDGLVSVGAPQSPAKGHLVALVVADHPNFKDFHWYRLDAGGMWSHKPGSTAATNLDNSGNPIKDPRTANRGPYQHFCGFFVCDPSVTKII